MAPISYARHQYPPAVIQHSVWLYLRFTLSYRDVEELLAERRLDVSYESIRRWVLKFGPAFARRLQRRRPRPSSRWHLDEMVVLIGGKRPTFSPYDSRTSASRSFTIICSGVYLFRLIPSSFFRVQNKPDPLIQPGPLFPWQVAVRHGKSEVGAI
jgi:hypothetical protein